MVVGVVVAVVLVVLVVVVAGAVAVSSSLHDFAWACSYWSFALLINVGTESASSTMAQENGS